MPTIYVLIGLPASGKSTWRAMFKATAENLDAPLPVEISSDDIIDEIAASKGLTYSQVFMEAIKVSDKLARQNFEEAVAARRDIILDRTNMTLKGRAKFLASLPKTYEKHAIVFEVPDDVLNERLEKRNATGKIIPKSVIDAMRASYQPPSEAEGFDKIEFVRPQ